MDDLVARLNAAAASAHDHQDLLSEAAQELERMKLMFTRLDQPKYKGAPMLDEVLKEPNLDFRAWVETLPSAYWARYDLSAARIGWEGGCAFGLARGSHQAVEGPE